MQVVGYLNHHDLLLEDEQGVMVIGDSRYVLSLGDRVYMKQPIDAEAGIYQVDISFESSEHTQLHSDEIRLKFEGCRDKLKQYLHSITVH